MYKKYLVVKIISMFLSLNVISCDVNFINVCSGESFRLKLQKKLASEKITDSLFNFIEIFPNINVVRQPIKFNFPSIYSDPVEMIDLSAFTKDYYTFSYLKPVLINMVDYIEYRQFSMDKDLFFIFSSFFKTLRSISFDTFQNKIVQSIRLLENDQNLRDNGFILEDGQDSQWKHVFCAENYITNPLFPTPIDAHLIINCITNKTIIFASKLFTVKSMRTCLNELA